MGNNADFDIVVIGGGSAGLGAARTARRRGAAVALVEAGRIGGDCTFSGCVPSKALLEAAHRGLGFAEAMESVRRAVEEVAAGEDEAAITREGITVVPGLARLAGRGMVEVEGRRINARRAVVIATGASPAVPPIPGLAGADFLTNENLFGLERLPASLAILGGGPIGVEMAEAFALLGSRVSVLEAMDRLLPREEPEASEIVERSLRLLGVEVRTGTPVHEVRSVGPRCLEISVAGGPPLRTEAMLVAVGRVPASGGVGLEEAGVALDARGFIRVDAHLRTSLRDVYAAGDVASPLQFTHVAYRTGAISAINALSPVPLARFRPEFIPAVTFTSPEVARIGVMEAEAPPGARVAYLPMSEVDRAVAARRTEGFVKLIAGPRTLTRHLAAGRILGATIVCERAGEMLAEPALAMCTSMFAARLALTVHAYPTWSTAVQQAAAQLLGDGYGGRRARVLHKQAGQGA
ncbi:MAG: NAD(P)/FAD-dependent oxidoreductase [Actinomycetota bacterium]|nr:NAD(P)/FAD-dependent oxidoreductase [Actinomycetota bacterium]